MLDYEDVNECLQAIENKGEIKKRKPIGYTTFGLPIMHYTYGNGSKHIVISGATHGAEIITTDLVLKLMKQIPNNIDSQTFTIHFIPILNPEGYIVSTSAIRQLIPQNITTTQSQAIIKKYIKDYNAHDYSYQTTFADIDYTCIPEQYSNLRNNIKALCEKYNIPKGTLEVWSSNGNGIDLNQNCPYNTKMKYLRNEETLFGKGAYGNINMTTPGPIGCPSQTKEFKYEPETLCFRKFILGLKHDQSVHLCAYLNYHSAENTIFYKPLSGIKTEETLADIEKLTNYNRNLAKKYSNITDHELYNGETKYCCFNDMLRLEIPGDILIELCPNEGNPLSAYEDVVYQKTIEKNIEAAIETINYIK